jgi:hypothetical protein
MNEKVDDRIEREPYPLGECPVCGEKEKLHAIWCGDGWYIWHACEKGCLDDDTDQLMIDASVWWFFEDNAPITEQELWDRGVVVE